MSVWLVSRHPGALEWLSQRGVLVDCIIPHIHVEQVCAGDLVIGTLPVHLAAEVCQRGGSYFHLALSVPQEWRGRELTLAQMEQCGAELLPFTIHPPDEDGEDPWRSTTHESS